VLRRKAPGTENIARRSRNGRFIMPRFVTIGYGDQAGYDRTPTAIRDAAHATDQELKAGGAIMGVAGAVVQVRNPEANGVETFDGPYANGALPVAGFSIIEAETLKDAIAMVSQSTMRRGAWRRRGLAADRKALDQPTLRLGRFVMSVSGAKDRNECTLETLQSARNQVAGAVPR
jgi:hypothetical protein